MTKTDRSFDAAPLPLWLCRLSGRGNTAGVTELHPNPAAEKLCPEHTRQTVPDPGAFFSHTILREIAAAAEAALQPGDTEQPEATIRATAPNGQEMILSLGAVEQHPDGTVSLLLGASLLPESADPPLIARLPDANPDTVIILECSGLRVSYLNPAGSRLLAEQELQNPQDIFSILPADFASDLCRRCRQNRKKEVITRSYLRHGHRFIMKIRPFENEGSCMITLTDVSEIDRIRREKELYYEAIQSLQQPLIITDRSGHIVEVNRAFTDLYGFSREEVIGKNPRILNPGLETYCNLGFNPDQYRKQFQQMWRSILQPGQGYWEGELVNRKKDGTLVWINLLINAVRFNGREETDRAEYFIALPVDMTRNRVAVNRSKMELYNTIANLAELRDNETGNHMRRVGLFARQLAHAAGQTEKFCRDIEIFAPMHDIGKVGISDAILLAPRRLELSEFEQMKHHTTFGFRIVAGVAELEMAAAIILHHHEKWDGSGYPSGLQGEAIPLAARITALADVYDALRSERPYKQPWDRTRTEQLIFSSAGTHFDPEMVRLFSGLTEKFDTVYRELQD